MLSYTATIETRGMIEGLSYWISDIEYIKERFGVDVPGAVYKPQNCRELV